MGKKKTNAEIKTFFNNMGYNPLEEYKGNNIPIKCEKDGYYYQVRFDNLQSGKTPSLWGKSNINNLSHNIEYYLKQTGSDSEYLGFQQITKSHQKRFLVQFRCACGTIFNKTIDKMISNKYICCHNCATHFRGKNQRKGNAKIIKFVESKGYTVLDKNREYLTNEYIEVQDEFGYIGFVKDNKLRQSVGMSRFDIRINKKNYIHNVNVWAKTHCFKAECVGFSNKQYTTQSLEFKCSCGNHFVTSIASFQNGKIKCDKCSKRFSSYETIFEKFLIDNHIDYIHQYSLNQCKDVLPLPFDFYLPRWNLLIEIDGEGHFHPCHFNQISEEDANIAFRIIKKHDEIKTKFCQENHLPLLRIPYTAFNMQNDYQILFSQFIEA